MQEDYRQGKLKVQAAMWQGAQDNSRYWPSVPFMPRNCTELHIYKRSRVCLCSHLENKNKNRLRVKVGWWEVQRKPNLSCVGGVTGETIFIGTRVARNTKAHLATWSAEAQKAGGLLGIIPGLTHTSQRCL